MIFLSLCPPLMLIRIKPYEMKINGLYQRFETNGNWNAMGSPPAEMTFIV
jgi:hypothetical protein